MATKSGASAQTNGRVDQTTKDRRRRAGAYIKACREAANLSQKNVGDALGYEYYTTVSQIERGVTTLPMELFPILADLLDVDRFTFANTLMKLYHPEVQQIFEQELKRRAYQQLDRGASDRMVRTP